VTAAAGGLLLAVLATASPAPQQISKAPPTAASPPREAAAAGTEASPGLAHALDRALAEGWRDLHLETECVTDAGFRTAEVFGSGVGVWNRRAQFRLGRDELRTLLEAFREARFADMEESYGGRRDPVVRENQSPRATCRVVLRLDGVRKGVVQLQHGRQSEELHRLAVRILETCEGPAQSGRSAASLADGLAKVAAGELAAETLHLLAHRKVEADDTKAGRAEGWLLRVDGRQASTQRLAGDQGYAEPAALELGLEDLASLAALLRENGVADLPVNLYAEHYTELVVSVLNWRKALQARPFAGMTRATHGEKQKRFDQLFGRLQDLERRVGERASGPGQGQVPRPEPPPLGSPVLP
jgi:hypothetical protein